MTREAFFTFIESVILRREGWPKYTNHRADKGGPTKGGITLSAYSKYLGRSASIEELKAVTEPQARAFYRYRYILPWMFIKSDRLLETVVDYAVNSWHDDPTKALQQAVGVNVDGLLGPITRNAVTMFPDAELLRKKVLQHRGKKYVSLVINDPDMVDFMRDHPEAQIHNLAGWQNRLLEQI